MYEGGLNLFTPCKWTVKDNEVSPFKTKQKELCSPLLCQLLLALSQLYQSSQY